MTEIYLGEPPEYIKNWMLQHQDGGEELDKPLRFTAAEAGASVCLNRKLDNDIIDNTSEDYSDRKLINLQYSLNGNAWSKYTLGTVVTLDKNNYVEFKALGNNETISQTDNNYYTFAIEKKVNASGNIQSLLVEDGFKDKDDAPFGCYIRMFYGCTSLQTAPDLPAMTLSKYCYRHMFEGCTNL